jgi:hypothetical protein
MLEVTDCYLENYPVQIGVGAHNPMRRELVRRKAFLLITVAGLLVVASRPAMAELILVGPEVLSGSGFGALPRALTIQSHGPNRLLLALMDLASIDHYVVFVRDAIDAN